MEKTEHFKTSHVIVYHTTTYVSCVFFFISKHLMLLFITCSKFIHLGRSFQNISCYCLSLRKYKRSSGGWIFQNISCYCLSFLIVAVQLKEAYFKTSHVIVYPKKTEHRSSHKEFQNISCYCLSIMKICSFTRPELFQNISCYCLSDEVDTINFAGYIFQNISCYCLSRFHGIFR